MKNFHKTSKYNYNLFKNYLINNQIIFLYAVKNIKRETLYKTRQQLNEKNIKLIKINNIISQKIFVNQLNKQNFFLFQSETLIGFPLANKLQSIDEIKKITDLKLNGINLTGVIINKKLIIPINFQNNLNINQVFYKNLFNRINHLAKLIIFSTLNKSKFFLLPLHFNILK